MYSLPQEIEVWYIIPTVRKILADHLVKDHGLSYEKVGRILGVTKAAIAQYVHNKRAAKINLSKDIKKKLKGDAEILVLNNEMFPVLVHEILEKIKNTKASCDTGKVYKKSILEYCNGEYKY
jgi:predicted transcriptional regulator